MIVHLEYTAVLAIREPASGSALDIPDNSSVRDLLTRLAIPADHQKYVVTFINQRQARPADRLRGGDRVFLSLPVGGG